MNLDAIRDYLKERAGSPVKIISVRDLAGRLDGEDALKQFGFGRPLCIGYRADDEEEEIVFHRIRRNAFGREREDDRVAAVWLDFRTFNHLPGHVSAMDMVARMQGGGIRSIGEAEELLLVSGYREGQTYAQDLLRIQDQGSLTPQDIERAKTLATYLAEIHGKTHEDELLWRRRLRDLIGHGEGIFGITDSYPEGVDYITPKMLREIEEDANHWRWRLKPRSRRLCQVHGDFHPFNVLFQKGLTYHLLDRSRGEWGEAADDVSCMAINYIFFSLQKFGVLEGPFQELHDAFWKKYHEKRSDPEMVTVIQPWFAWRALVLMSPVWYPDISVEIRRKLLAFTRRVLSEEVYDPGQINEYLGAM